MYPPEEPKLSSEVSLLQRHNESNESDYVQGKADDPVIRSERHELCVSEDDVLNEDG